MTVTDLFHDPARTDAEDAARALTHQAERIGLPLHDIEITAPCPTCRRAQYTLDLGNLTPGQAHQLASALRAIPADTLGAVPEDEG
ncbi:MULTISPECIES: hypothetical protein [unclassified Streptomyces]|uniref:hypothetical protein n=1 Tax=unclassified Streptomyces TaxID=2593676 RepID=UPI000CD56799|nr:MULTISPECIES: hypothetical protein [unclassified Streptomyces]